MRRLHDDSGQALVFTAVCMTCLFGMIAFAADVGVMLRDRRLLQVAADAAAVAGASELSYGGATSAAKSASATNGFTDGSNGVTVTVSTPPATGTHTGCTGCVEVVVTKAQPTLFMKFFSFNSINVKARAVATNAGIAQGCVIVTSKNASPAMTMQGSFDVSTPSCGIVVNSNASGALNFTGAGGTLTAGSVGVAGTATGQTGDSTPAPVTGIVPVSDPMQSLPAPTYNTNPSNTCTSLPATSTLGPATSGGTVCYNGSGSKNTIALSNVTLNPGVYVMNGNVTFSGSVTGSGVTLYLLAGLDASNGTLNLVAPTTGTYAGDLLFAARTDTSALTFDKGNASGVLKGIIYAPAAPMILHDSGGDTSGGLQLITDLIVNTLSVQTSTLAITSYSQTTGLGPLVRVTLVE